MQQEHGCLRTKMRNNRQIVYWKNTNYLKSQTHQHIGDVWKVIESRNKKFGPNWRGMGGFVRADAFAQHFGNICREFKTFNQVKAKMKKLWFLSYCARVIESAAWNHQKPSNEIFVWSNEKKSSLVLQSTRIKSSTTTPTSTAPASARADFISLPVLLSRQWGSVLRRKSPLQKDIKIFCAIQFS